MRYAQVAVDSNVRALDRTFTYIIPEDMEISAGDMVRVPFGSRHTEGFVIEITNECDLDKDKLKAISSKSSANSAILPELMQLARFMREKYQCTLADALRLMLPPQMRAGTIKQRSVRVARLIIDEAEALEKTKNAQKQQKIVQILLSGEQTINELENQVKGASNACNSLKAKGVIEIFERAQRRRPRYSDNGRSSEDPKLTDEQQSVSNELIRALDFGDRFLLYGVTGSGKTEVYIKLIREVLRQGKSAIILVPEISLTPQTVGWFHARFGDNSAVIHSRLSAGERYDEWQRIYAGEAKVVIGARSAVFAPVQNLGAIIIDEEHEGAYISEKHPRYDARDIAAERTKISNGVLLLGSATPSISSFMRTMPKVKPENKLKLLELDKRVFGRQMPKCELVDMRRELAEGNKGIFSLSLISALKQCMDDNDQAMLFINRRGHSSFVNCRACGHVEKCENCDVAMTYHSQSDRLVCHYCGLQKPVPVTCPECKSRFIKFFGAGTERIVLEAQKLFPDKKVLRMDMDTTSGKDAHAEILDRFARGEADILVGTQMIAKGLDFPNVTLVGAVAADTTLNLPDYRSAERTFQLLTQVAGRAGRADKPGRVIIQSYTPENYALQCALKQDYRAFYHAEVAYRKRSLYPPYTMIARLLYSSRDELNALNAAIDASKALKSALNEKGLMKSVLSITEGPAPIKRIKSESRYEVLVKIFAGNECDSVLAEMTALEKASTDKVNVQLEINPANLF